MGNRRVAQRLGILLTIGLLAGCGSGGDESNSNRNGLGITSGSATATITNSVDHPSEMQVGDVYQLLFSGGEQGLIDLSGTDSSSQFLLAVASLDHIDGLGKVVVSSDVSVGEEDLAAMSVSKSVDESNSQWSWSAQDAFELNLRSAESMMAHQNLSQANLNLGKSAMIRPESVLGDVEEFRVLSNLSSLKSYVTVNAELKCVGEQILWYVDVSVLSAGSSLNDSDIQKACARFDAQVQEEYKLFGSASDVDNDGRISVLMTAQVNRLGASGGGIITGFFLAGDLYSRSNANPLSNEREIIYAAVPDVNGSYGVRISKELALNNLLPAVLPHELQHAINYNQHVLVRGSSPEQNWLNEGLSHLAEDLLGVGLENPSRYEIYLQQPSNYGLITEGSPGLAERGGIFLFLRYLYEQNSNAKKFIWDAVNTDLSGVTNIEVAYNGTDAEFDQFAEFMLRWSATLALNNTGLTADVRYNYASRSWDNVSKYFSGVCTICSAEDGRSTQLDGITPKTLGNVSTLSIDGAAVQYYLVGGWRDNVALYSSDSRTYGAILIRIN